MRRASHRHRASGTSWEGGSPSSWAGVWVVYTGLRRVSPASVPLSPISLFLGGWRELPVWFPVLPALRSLSLVKPPPFRHRNSPSCEMKVPEFKIVTGCYLYSSRKDVFFSAAVYFVVVPTARAASSRLWGQVGGERGLQVWGAGTRPAQKCRWCLPGAEQFGWRKGSRSR